MCKSAKRHMGAVQALGVHDVGSLCVEGGERDADRGELGQEVMVSSQVLAYCCELKVRDTKHPLSLLGKSGGQGRALHPIPPACTAAPEKLL